MWLTNFINRSIYRGFSPIWWLRKLCLTIFYFREYLRRKKWKSKGVIDENIVQHLNQEGFSYIKFDKPRLSCVIQYCRLLSQELDPLDQPPPKSEGKDFWRFFVDGNNVKKHPILINFARSEYFKNLASAYLGQEAILSNLALIKSYPIDKSPTHSQVWHLDADDSRLLVFYLYVNDVNTNCGPFELIPKTTMKRVFTPRYFRKYGLSDKEMNKYTLSFCPTQLIGPPGTMFVSDTAKTYHRGSRSMSSTRLVLTFRYQTFTGLAPPVLK